jgi:nitroreductase
MDALELLLQRNSAPKLAEPGPDAAALETIFRAALRAPDHARLRPWRFLVVAGEARNRFGELMVEVAGAEGEKANQMLAKPLRAPVIVVVAVKLSVHPKVPEIEQYLSAGCAAHGVLLAAEALGYAGIWRTGNISFQPGFHNGLGLDADERIVGFIYLGTRVGGRKPVAELDTADFVRHWQG